MIRCLSNTSCEMADRQKAEKRAFWENKLGELKKEKATLQSSFDKKEIAREEWLQRREELQDKIAELERGLGKSQTGGKSEVRPSAPEGEEYEEGEEDESEEESEEGEEGEEGVEGVGRRGMERTKQQRRRKEENNKEKKILEK